MRTFELKLGGAGFSEVAEVDTRGGFRVYHAYRNDTQYTFYVDMLTPRTFYTYYYTVPADEVGFHPYPELVKSDLHPVANFNSLPVDTHYKEWGE